MFVCGDDEEAKGVTGDLVGELGFETIDAGVSWWPGCSSRTH